MYLKIFVSLTLLQVLIVMTKAKPAVNRPWSQQNQVLRQQQTSFSKVPMSYYFYRNLRGQEVDPILARFTTAELKEVALVLEGLKKGYITELTPKQEQIIQLLLDSYGSHQA